MAVVGSAEVLIRPSFRGFQSAARKAGVAAGGAAGKSLTARLGSSIANWGKRIAKAGVVAAGAAIGAGIVGGVRSALSQQASTMVLTGLYNDAELAKSTMESLNEVARKSPLGADAFRKGAESLAYAGVQGDSAVKTLENVGKTIVGAGGTAEQVDQFSNALLNGVNRGKFSLNELNQISKAGVPIFSSLAENMGLSMEEVTKMASEGKIGLEDVMDVLENADTEAFQQSIRAGEEAQKSFLNTAKTLWNEITVQLGDRLQPVLEWATEKFREIAEKVGPKLEAFLDRASESISIFIQEWKDGEGAGGRFRESLTNIWEAAQDMWDTFQNRVLPVIQKFLGWLTSSPGTLKAVAAGVLAIVAAWQAYRIGMAAARAITVIFTGVQAALNAVLNMNPIGLIVLAITGLVAAFVTAYKRSEKFREVVDKAWAGIKKAASAVVGWFQDKAMPVLKKVWDAISTAAMWMWENAIQPAWEAIKIGWDAVVTAAQWAWENILQPVWDAISTAAMWMWENAIQPAWEAIKIGWDWLVAGMEWAWENILEPVWDAVATVALWLWDNALKPVFDWIAENWDEIAEGIKIAWEEYIKPAWETLSEKADEMWEETLKPTFNWIGEKWEEVSEAIDIAWNEYIKPTWDAVSEKATELWEEKLKPTFEWIGEKWETLSRIIEIAWEEVIKPSWDNVKEKALWLWDKILKPTFDWIGRAWKHVSKVIKAAWEEYIKPAWNTMKDTALWLWNKILKPTFHAIGVGWTVLSNTFRTVWNWINKYVFQPFMRGVNRAREAVSNAVSNMRTRWEALKNAFKRPWDWIKTNVIDRFRNSLTRLRDHVRKMRTSIGDAWRGIANRFRTPINWVLNKVWNNGLAKAFNNAAKALKLKTRLTTEARIPAFAKGGLAKKGWALVGEEGPELVNFDQPGRVYTAQETARALSLARAGDAGATDSLPAMGGGVASRAWQGVKDTAGAVTGWVRGGLAAAADALLSPIRKLISPTVSQWGSVGDIAGGAMKSSLDSLVKWIRGKDDVGPAGGVVDDISGGKWRRPSRGRVTSGYGPRSLMGMGFHAGVDFAGGGPTFAAAAGKVFRTGWNILSGRTGIGIGIDHGGGVFTYYGHNPSMGAIKVRPGDMVRAGQHIGYEGATGRVTGPHLHFETHRGGWGRHVNPRSFGIFDRGGWLEPGMLAYHSARMSKPDAVLTASQWDAMHRLADRAAVVSLSDGDVGRIAEAVREGAEVGVGSGLGGVGRGVRLRGVGG